MSGWPVTLFATFMSFYISVSFWLMPNYWVEVELEMNSNHIEPIVRQ